MTKYFVTGGSGFLGSHLIKRLRADGAKVNALVRSKISAQFVKSLGANAIEGDLDNIASMVIGMKECAVAFHCAALTEDWGKKQDFHRVNVIGTRNVLESAVEAGVPTLVHVSTEAVLAGGGPIVRATDAQPIAKNPAGLYPWSKGQAERVILEESKGRIKSVIIRPRFIWGANDTSVLLKIILAIKSGRFAWISGGHYLTSTCHVENVCEGAICAAANGQAGEIYFLTDGSPVEFRKFITDLLQTQTIEPGEKEISRSLVTIIAKLSEIVWKTFRLPGAPVATLTTVKLAGEEVTVDDTKARTRIGYKPVKTIEDGLAELSQLQLSKSSHSSDRGLLKHHLV